MQVKFGGSVHGKREPPRRAHRAMSSPRLDMLAILRQVVGDREPGALEPTKICAVGRIDVSSMSVPIAT